MTKFEWIFVQIKTRKDNIFFILCDPNPNIVCLLTGRHFNHGMVVAKCLNITLIERTIKIIQIIN